MGETRPGLLETRVSLPGLDVSTETELETAMDIPDGGIINVTNANRSPSSPPLEADPLFSDDPSAAKARRIKSPGILRRLAGRFWQILMLWLVLSASVAFLIYPLTQPTYEAASLLRIEPATINPFGPLERGAEPSDGQPSIYLKTQVGLITSAKVLVPAIADPLVAILPTIRKAVDPKTDLLENLKVEIVPGTNLIRIALELPNPEEAGTIVQAVVQSYLTQNVDYTRSANRDLTESLKQQLLKIAREIDLKRSMLKELSTRRTGEPIKPRELLNPKTETDPTQPTLNKATEEQFAKLIDKQVECDLAYLDALSQLEAVRAVRERNLDRMDQEWAAQALDEFKRDPKVAALVDQIDEAKRMGESKEQTPSPAVLAARERHKNLSSEFDTLWTRKGPDIRKRLAEADHGPFSEARIRELEVAVEKARRKKEGFAQQFEKVEVIREKPVDAALEANYLTDQVEALQKWENQVKQNLEQLKFEASQDKYRVALVDSATASKTPTNNKRLFYMGAAPVVILFALLGLFLAQEIAAVRTAAVR
jgi:polysaccharide biosynthesis transport protein